jgi:hypothetical protein
VSSSFELAGDYERPYMSVSNRIGCHGWRAIGNGSCGSAPCSFGHIDQSGDRGKGSDLLDRSNDSEAILDFSGSV